MLSATDKSPNKYVFSFCLKTVNVRFGRRGSAGSSFHNLGSAAVKLLSIVCTWHRQHSDVVVVGTQWSKTDNHIRLLTTDSRQPGTHGCYAPLVTGDVERIIHWPTGSQHRCDVLCCPINQCY